VEDTITYLMCKPHLRDGDGAVPREGADFDSAPRAEASTSRAISWPCSGLICIRAPAGTARTVSARSFCSTWH